MSFNPSLAERRARGQSEPGPEEGASWTGVLPIGHQWVLSLLTLFIDFGEEFK